MMRFRSLVLLLTLAAACSGRGAAPAAPRAAAGPQTVVLVSLDGFRPDYLDRPGAVNLRALAAEGVRARAMEPVFPTKTFPNHYSLVTGLHPARSGIISNTMEDPELGRFAISDTNAVRDARWWGGEPFWVTVERQGLRAAAFFWPGSEAAIDGIRPTWYERFDDSVPFDTRVRRVLSWLRLPADSAPRFITLYFSAVDGAGHRYGPAAPQTDSAIARVDSAIGALRAGIRQMGGRGRGVNVIVVSDHGMAPVSRDRLVFLDDLMDLAGVRVVDWSPVAMLRPPPERVAEVVRALSASPHLRVYPKEEIPDRFRFRDHPRIPPVIAIAEEGWSITTRARLAALPPNWSWGGDHGYDNALPSMQALFAAAGPAFARGRVVDRVRAVDLYDLMASILGVVPAPNDGSLDSIRVVLR
jgi:predicted AlkP superfamily pyrophosphatase or phosphodiesterase